MFANFFKKIIKVLKLRLVSVLFILILSTLVIKPNYWNQGATFLNTQIQKIPEKKVIRLIKNITIPSIEETSFRLGLDLQGGSQLIYLADMKNIENGKQQEAIEGVRDLIERRVNAFGVAEPIIQTTKVKDEYRLIVELAGVKDIKEAIKMIGETPFLEFREQREKEESDKILKAQEKVRKAFQEQKNNLDLSQFKEEMPLLGEDPYFIPTSLTGKHLKDSNLSFDQLGKPVIQLKFNEEGTKLFKELTKKNIGKPLAIYLDKSPISAPKVNEEISGGEAVISGQFSREEGQKLAMRLKTGALPVPINLISQKNIEASLGKEEMEKSLSVGLIAFSIVAVFMILWYRLPGLLADLALLLYVIITLAIFKFISATLTLPGIAGFILSIGMAVDANILIFARMKEESKRGRNFSQSIEQGFKRAWTSIRDGNLTTIISCLVLYFLTTSAIKGFALTLFVGVLTSMFSAIFISKSFLKFFAGSFLEKINWIWYK